MAAFAQNRWPTTVSPKRASGVQVSLRLSLAVYRKGCSMLAWLVATLFLQLRVETCPCGASLLPRL